MQRGAADVPEGMGNVTAQAVVGALVTVGVVYYATPWITQRFPFAGQHKELISAVPVVAGLATVRRGKGYSVGAVVSGMVMAVDNVAVSYFNTDVV